MKIRSIPEPAGPLSYYAIRDSTAKRLFGRQLSTAGINYEKKYTDTRTSRRSESLKKKNQ